MSDPDIYTLNFIYCRTHSVSVCLYIAYIACGSASLYIKTLYFFLTVLALSAAATVANIKIRYDAKIPQFAIFGTHVIYVFCSILFECSLALTSNTYSHILSVFQNDCVVETTLVGWVMNGLSHLYGVKEKPQFAVALIRGLGGNLNEGTREKFAKEVANKYLIKSFVIIL